MRRKLMKVNSQDEWIEASFCDCCGKLEDFVKVIIVLQHVRICDECIELAHSMLNED